MRTDGWITPGNIVSAVGAYLTVRGLLDYTNGEKTKGVGKVFAGRMCDIADGLIAKKTGTRSAKGAVLDAGLDKYCTVAATTVLCNDGISPIDSVGMAGLQIDIVRSSMEIDARGGRPDPKTLGKIGMLGTWLWIGSSMAESATSQANRPKTALAFEALNKVLRPTALGLTVQTALDYRRRLGALEQD